MKNKKRRNKEKENYISNNCRFMTMKRKTRVNPAQ